MEVVEHQEGVELGDLVITEGPFQMDAGPFDGGPAFENLGDAANGHGCSSECR